MACNTLFGAGNGLINPPVPDKTFTLSQAEIAVFDRDVYQLMLDIETLHDMAKVLNNFVFRIFSCFPDFLKLLDR